MPRGHFHADLRGERFQRLTVKEYAGRRGKHATWVCLCDCGNEVTVVASNLRRGNTKSCGCWSRDSKILNNITHGQNGTRAHNSWMAMRQRCLNPSSPAFQHYGGRGITICARWSEFANFIEDMGPCPDGMELERMDVNGMYEPLNCRWATVAEQALNKRNTVLVTLDGRTQPLKTWARELGIRYHSLYRRIVKKGESPDTALRRPLAPGVRTDIAITRVPR